MKGSAPGRVRGGRDRSAKQRLRAELAREQRRIARRLESAVAANVAGPVLGRSRAVYELSGRSRAITQGGMGVVARLVDSVGLADEIDSELHLLAAHRPYFESDHVLNIASAPRGALTYPPRSGEGLEVISLGPVAYLDLERERGQ